MTTPATAQHTPGPWNIVNTNDDYKRLQIHADSSLVVALVTDVDDQPQRYPRHIRDANARLIAEAPAMRDAIESAFFLLGRLGANADTQHPGRAEWERLRALLARIEGR